MACQHNQMHGLLSHVNYRYIEQITVRQFIVPHSLQIDGSQFEVDVY
jgi:hypothetical protein